ncbi:Opi1-domain-containing protein, partial [Sistotremastrum niveocremeum HHB9708]
MVESSVISMTRPVMHHLPVDQLDEFACRQLDRFGRGKGTEDSTLRLRANRGSLRERDGETRREDDADGPGSSSDALQAGVSRSTWQTMLFEAGGIGAAVSEESMRRLKYCLHWLQFATARIDQQIIILRDFIANMHPPNSDTPSTNETISSSHLQTLQEVKKEVVQTIRQVIDVVSKYAGGALPEPARVTVRNFILHLPQRWASAAQEMVEPSPRPIRGRRPRGSRQNSRHHIEPAASSSSTRPTQDDACTTASAADQAAKKILTLATESLDMLRNVTAVFKESLDRADAWVERLRVIGIQRQQSDAIDVGVPSQALDDDAHSSIHKRLGSSSTVSSYYATPSASLSSPPPDTPSVASPDLYPRSLADEDHSDSADSEDEARPRKALKL